MGQLNQLWNIVCLDRMIGKHFNSCSCPEKTQVKSANNPSLTPPPQTHTQTYFQCTPCTTLLVYCWRVEWWCLAILYQRKLMWLMWRSGGMRARPTLYTVPGSGALYPQASWSQRLSLDLCLSPLFPCGRIPLALSHSLHVRGLVRRKTESSTDGCTSHPVNSDCADYLMSCHKINFFASFTYIFILCTRPHTQLMHYN